MSPAAALASAPEPVALSFEAAGAWCFGWYHAPAAPWRDMVVVLCQPIGYEAICSYPTQVQLARSLAQAGFPVLRFDYHGSGDSAGEEDDPGRVAAWLASTAAAVAQARLRSQAGHVALLGWRLGATLAVETAARLGGIDGLVLWAPCATGKAFTRELRAAGQATADGALHAMGHVFTAETLQDLAALDACRPATPPAPHALVVGRDDLPAEGPLPAALRRAGVDTTFQVLPGWAAMVEEPRAGVLSAETLQTLADWLAALPGAAWRADAPHLCTDVAPLRTTGAVAEIPLRAGPGGLLHGVLAEPAPGPADDARGHTAVVLLNVGGNYRIGPHRVYVRLARWLAAAGWRVLRLDIAGIGDSPPAPGAAWASLYDKESSQDVRAAIDALAARGCREVVLMGICSGSYVAFQTALVDPRVGGLVLMNSRLLDWTPGRPGDTWQTSMQQYAKSTDYYKRSFFKPEVWARVLRGQVNVRLIANRFLAVVGARLRRLVEIGGPHEESLFARMRRLVRRGTDVLMLVADADDGRDYVEFHFGSAGSRLRGTGNFRMAYIADADHTFSKPGNQAAVLQELLRHLDARVPAGESAPAPAPSAPSIEPMAGRGPVAL